MRTLQSILPGAAAAILLATLPASLAAQVTPGERVDVSGKWVFTVNTDAGTGTPTITLTQKGDSLTGNYSSQALGEAELKGTVKDGKIEFSVLVSVEGTSFTVTYSGAIEGRDSMKGTVSLGDLGSGTFTARRQ